MFKISARWACTLQLILCLFLFYLIREGENPAQYFDTVKMYKDELYEKEWLAKRRYHKALSPLEKNKIICIGDSMIERGDWSNPLAKCANYGISGESIRQLYYRLEKDKQNFQHATVFVILTAVNDLSDLRNGDSEQSVEKIGYIFKRLSEKLTGKIIIIKLVRVDQTIFDVPSNYSIDRVNNLIDLIFRNRPDTIIIDINPIVAPHGTLLSQYHVDGQHLSAAGYKELYQAVHRALIQLRVIDDALVLR